MPSTSKSNRRKSKKTKFVSKPKHERRVEQPTRNWLELPSDLMVNILQRVGVIDILENAQKVCTDWRKICNDPTMWRVICMKKGLGSRERVWQEMRKMYKHALDRSQGQLVDLTIGAFANYEIVQYIANRSSQLRRLEIKFTWPCMYGYWSEILKKLPLLVEFSVDNINRQDIEAAGRYCPLLKTLRVNLRIITLENKTALAIGKNLPKLTHLTLVGSIIDNTGLQAILDGCHHLESLDLRQCFSIDSIGDLEKRCSKQIKFLKLPRG